MSFKFNLYGISAELLVPCDIYRAIMDTARSNNLNDLADAAIRWEIANIPKHGDEFFYLGYLPKSIRRKLYPTGIMLNLRSYATSGKSDCATRAALIYAILISAGHNVILDNVWAHYFVSSVDDNIIIDPYFYKPPEKKFMPRTRMVYLKIFLWLLFGAMRFYARFFIKLISRLSRFGYG